MTTTTDLPVRAWFTLNRSGRVTGVLHLTDEQALTHLTRLLPGEQMEPVGGRDNLYTAIAAETCRD